MKEWRNENKSERKRWRNERIKERKDIRWKERIKDGKKEIMDKRKIDRKKERKNERKNEDMK